MKTSLERSQYRTNDSLPKEETTDSQVLGKEGRGRYHQEDVKHASAAKKKKGRPKKRWLDNIRDDMKWYKITEDMAQNRSVCHMKTTTGQFLYGGGI